MNNIFCTGFSQGFCQDEDGKELDYGEHSISEEYVKSESECIDFCMLDPLATACEYNLVSNLFKCSIHTFTVGRHTNGDKNGQCSLILPKGKGLMC